MDLGILVIVQPVVGDFVPVLGEIKVPRVFGVVAAFAEAVFLACSAFRVISLRNSALSGSATCFDPGPWQFSHWLPARCGVAASDCQPELYSKAGRVAGDAFRVENRVGLGVVLERFERLGVLGRGPELIGVGMTFLARLGADEGRTGSTVDNRGGESSRRHPPP